MFSIPPALRGIPLAWKGHYYARDGESLVPLNIEKIERIRRQATNEDWSKGICADATLDDLDIDAIARARELFKSLYPADAAKIDQWDDITFFEQIESYDSRQNNSCGNNSVGQAGIRTLY